MNKRVFKKLSTPFEDFNPTAAILMTNLLDPQVSTLKVFLEAIKNKKLPFFVVGNKLDLVKPQKVKELEKQLKLKIIPASLLKNIGISQIIKKIEQFPPKSRIAVLGVFNSGKTSLIAKLTGLALKIGDLPGTTLNFAEYKYKKWVLIDTVGQIIDVSKPLMISVDLSDCRTIEEKLSRCLRQDAEGILASLETAIEGLKKTIPIVKKQIEEGNKIIVTGAGASALVALEIAGQGWETGVPVIPITNNLSSAQPISFAKGVGEEEGGLARYIATVVQKGDVVIGISASGGTGFVYEALRLAKKKGAITLAITENIDTPLGKNADLVIKSNAKPEGPSSSKIQAAHLAIGHALILTLASERGITAEQSIEFMLEETIETKKMGIK
ncbi:MAG: SIS domain-containing protein [Microgenomates group bacterium]